MKKTAVVILVLGCSICFLGCGEKKNASEELVQESVSIEALSTTGSSQGIAPKIETQEVKAMPAVSETQNSEPKLESLPPSGPYKPTASEIQTALANAGFYTGKVDGKAGPMTKKAVEQFQKANSLEADGKVGPKTWVALSKYLNTNSGTEQLTSTVVTKKGE